MSSSVWRRVRARVHLSLTPAELSNPVRAATNRAFSSLLMRYSPELGGVVVAHIGPVHLSGPPTFIDASPFPHIAAIANLLVFAPTKGTQLLGVVTHVGPDHLGLSVLSAFHAVLPIEGVSHLYRFDSGYSNSTPSPTWRHINGQDRIAVNRQIRFVISELKPTRTGLFQIIASLDHTLRDHPNDAHPLGLLPREKQISLSVQTQQSQPDVLEPQATDLPEVNRRSSAAHEARDLLGDDLLTAGNDGFGDALMPIMTPISALKRKKRKRDGTRRSSVSLGEPGETEYQQNAVRNQNAFGSLENISSPTTAPAVERSEDTNGVVRAASRPQMDEKSDGKKRKRDKKKKKRMSRNALEMGESELQERAKDEEDNARRLEEIERARKVEVEDGSGGQSMVKQEQQTGEEFNSQDDAHRGRAIVESAKKEGKKKKKKKKRKERDSIDAKEAQLQQQRLANGTSDGLLMHDGRKESVVNREQIKGAHIGTMVVKEEVRQVSEAETPLKREKSMVVDAENAVDLGPLEGNKYTEDDNRLASAAKHRHQNSEERVERKRIKGESSRKKLKKKRKRSSEGELSSETKREKKKRKKRMSLGMGHL